MDLDPLIASLTESQKKPNRQLFENSELKDSVESGEYYAGAQSGDTAVALFNDAPPNFAIKSEKPQHRLLVYLKLQGLSNQECADKLNMSYGWVCQVTRQPWFRKAFVAEAQATGRDAVKAFFDGEVLNSAQVLVEIRDSAESDTVRLQAANAILDRGLGKAVQRTENLNINANAEDVNKEASKLKQEIDNINEQLKDV